MLTSRRTSLFFSVVFVAVTIAFPASSFAFPAFGTCEELNVFSLEQGVIQPSLAHPIRRYPLALPADQRMGGHLQYGFESEYTLAEIAGLLKLYAPKENTGIRRSDWRKLSPAEQLQWVNQHVTDLFPTIRTAGGLELDNPALAPTYLPRQLIRDTTGNLEIVLQPFDTLEEWYQAVSFINQKMGVGSMQATASMPGPLFLGAGAQNRDATAKENIGYFKFTNEFITIEKLEAGYQRYLADKTKAVVQSFQHPFLGPMTSAKQFLLEAYLLANSIGEKFDAASRAFISGSDASFKYTGGIVYRPDLASPERAVVEARDAHKRIDTLVNRVLWSSFFFIHSRTIFGPAAQIAIFDNDADFKKLSPAVQDMLKNLFPRKVIPGEQYSPEEERALEVYRNFAYPMKDWEPLLKFVNKLEFLSYVLDGQGSYSRSLDKISADLSASAIEANEASLRVQGALAEFPVRSRLADAMREWRQRSVYDTDSWKSFTRTIPQEIITAN